MRIFATNATSKMHDCAVSYHQTICAVKSDLTHLQHSKSLEQHKNEKLFELNVYFLHILKRFYI